MGGTLPTSPLDTPILRGPSPLFSGIAVMFAVKGPRREGPAEGGCSADPRRRPEAGRRRERNSCTRRRYPATWIPVDTPFT